MPPVAAAYTFTPVPGVTELLGGLDRDDDEDRDDEELAASVGGAFALEQAAAIRPSPTRIAAARSEEVERWGDFTGESIPVAPRGRWDRPGTPTGTRTRSPSGRRRPGASIRPRPRPRNASPPGGWRPRGTRGLPPSRAPQAARASRRSRRRRRSSCRS